MSLIHGIFKILPTTVAAERGKEGLVSLVPRLFCFFFFVRMVWGESLGLRLGCNVHMMGPQAESHNN